MKKSSPVFRIDRFRVPPERCNEFVARLRLTHATLGKMDGCLQNHILEEELRGPGAVHLLTVVQWRDERAFEQARQAMQASYREAGFDPQAFLQAAGIEVERSTCSLLPLSGADRVA
jgi:quinol monooxygenase YgiN